MDERTLKRFMAMVEVRPNGCWYWLGKLNRQGYGYFWFEGKSRLAHRFSFQQFVGPIPEGYEIDHLCHTRDKNCPGGVCDHRACVFPHDLEAVTELENVMRSRGLASANAAKTFCVNGHALTDANTYLYPGGRERGCRTCRTEGWRRHRDSRRDHVAVPMAERTECPAGHPYDEANTYVAPKTGARGCKTCRRIADREAKRAMRERKKAAESAS
ncbi:HNH endonuclease [Streptomyces sp. H10-C2]|uniref:HNH endonuclease n=1 Tax=unclassified Streptomyces TaxID=2593676 RepID=UPI0024BAF6A0|nr:MULTISPECIES: HNH endonuclease [unclassified Streptomyces]MDJ0342286.1 HNH endonuclease [Streptomyces sp. PH10-H1]MDJ0368800.1 HNH endonuclease [Streptomyces sp. H10-C2]